MRLETTRVIGVFVLATALVAGLAWAKKKMFDPSLYVGQDPADAAAAFLEMAEVEADDGTWERIYVARAYFLADQPQRGQEIFDAIVAKEAEASDWIRMGRVYYEVGDWDRAREAFERVAAMKPKDEDWLAEIGAYYNLQGERDQAEEYFRRSLAEDPDNYRNATMMGGSYLGVVPDP